MNYSILNAWVRESEQIGMQVEKLTQSGDCVRVRFKNGMQLVILTGSKDSFPYWDMERAQPAGSEIWPQMKHAELDNISLSDNDRIIYFSFHLTDIYQQNKHLTLIAEFTPGKPNLILAEGGNDLIIIDALRKYTYADNPQRQILPRLPYHAPHTSYKPLEQSVVYPLLLLGKSGEQLQECASANQYLRGYHQLKLIAEDEAQKREHSRLQWEKLLKKEQAKLQKQKAELADADKVEYWQVCSETLKHNLGQVTKGQKNLIATNYFDANLANIDIPLLEDKSPKQNLQYYFKKYQKAKRGAETIRQNIANTDKAISHLLNVLERIDSGEAVEFEGVTQIRSLGAKLDQTEKLLKLRLNEEFEIVIGRKARENDFITTQLGQAHDWWFHTRIYHGSHILLRCFKKTTPDSQTIEICCNLAAWYSKARFSLNVPVDYTQIRFVRKPRKSAPGYVTYSTHQTVFANPKDLRQIREQLGL